MDDTRLNRRRRAALAAGAAVLGTEGVASGPEAYQGSMERALSSLYDALAALREASSNKGGHRMKAMALIQQAIEQMQAGVEYADEYGGGGAQ